MKSTLLFAAALATATIVTSCTPPSNFDVADKDGDGKLSKEETEKALLSAIFANGDPDGDGQLSFVEVRKADSGYPKSRFDERDLVIHEQHIGFLHRTSPDRRLRPVLGPRRPARHLRSRS